MNTDKLEKEPEKIPQPHGGALKPYKPGQSGNISGKPKGRRNLSTIIRDMLENEIDWSLIPITNPEALKQRYKEKTAWEALVAVAFSKAMAGDPRAMAWLSKSGYGDKITHDFESSLFTETELKIKVVKPKVDLDGGDNTEREAGDGVESPGQSAGS